MSIYRLPLNSVPSRARSPIGGQFCLSISEVTPIPPVIPSGTVDFDILEIQIFDTDLQIKNESLATQIFT